MLKFLTSTLWTLTAMIPLMVANFFQMLSVVLLPLSRPLFFRTNITLAIAVWSWWSTIIERLHGTRLVVTGDALPPGESAVVIANHQAMGDIVVLLCLARRTGRMGDMRWMVKDEMRFVPFVGWGMLFLDFLFLKRDWSKDRPRILATFARLRASAAPVWLVLFPEGTRRTPTKHAASMEHARQSGLPELKNLMIPRTRGFVASVQGLEGKVAAVYRITIRYAGGGAPTLVDLFAGRVPEIRLDVRRHPLAGVPTDDASLAGWLHDEFRVMERLLSSS